MSDVTTTADVRPAPSEEELYCPSCGYDVRALAGKVCPECGEKIDLDDLRQSQVPWSYRQDLGRIRAYLKTMWLVTFHTKRFCREAARPVDLKDALRFRRWTVVMVYLGLVAMAMVPVYADGAALWRDPADELGLPQVVGDAWVAASLVLLWLWLYAATGVHTYWFHPRGLSVVRQNRLVALSYYVCAPLVLLPLVPAVLWTMMIVAPVLFGASPPLNDLDIALGILVGLVIFTVAIVALTGWWLAGVRMLATCAGRGWASVVGFAVIWPLTCVLLAGLIFVVVPVVVGYLAIAIWSLFQ